MEKINYKAKHGYNEYELVVKCHLLIEYAERDLEVLKDWGLTENIINEFKAKHLKLSELETPKLKKKEINSVLRKREEAFKVLSKAYKTFRSQAQSYFMDKERKYTSIFNRPVHNMSPEKLVNNIAGILNFFTENPGLIDTPPFSLDKIENLTKLYTEFENLLHKVNYTKADYKVYSVSYYNLVEEVYAYMSKISKMGKFYWADKSYSKYKQYRITPKGNKKRKTRSDKGKKRK